MKQLKDITGKLFKKNTLSSGQGNGLYASLDELIEQRRYAPFLQSKQTSAGAGDVRSAFKGRGMEFEEIRSYAFGDDVRDIDWRVTARKQQPYTKLYAEEKDREVYVLLDLSPYMLFGSRKELKSVSAAKTAARIAWMCAKNKDRFGCVISDGKEAVLLKAQNSQTNMMMILKKIADTSRRILDNSSFVSDSSGFIKAVKLLQQAVKHRAIIFVVSDFSGFGDESRKLLAQLAKKADITCVNVFDVLENCAPAAGEYMVQQDGRQLVFSSEPKSFRREYAAYFAEKHAELKRFCRRFKMHYLENKAERC